MVVDCEGASRFFSTDSNLALQNMVIQHAVYVPTDANNETANWVIGGGAVLVDWSARSGIPCADRTTRHFHAMPTPTWFARISNVVFLKNGVQTTFSAWRIVGGGAIAVIMTEACRWAESVEVSLSAVTGNGNFVSVVPDSTVPPDQIRFDVGTGGAVFVFVAGPDFVTASVADSDFHDNVVTVNASLFDYDFGNAVGGAVSITLMPNVQGSIDVNHTTLLRNVAGSTEGFGVGGGIVGFMAPWNTSGVAVGHVVRMDNVVAEGNIGACANDALVDSLQTGA